MRSILLLFVLFVFFGCTSKNKHSDAGYSVIFSHIKKMQKSKGWFMEAYGGSFYGGDVKQLTARFMVVDDEKFDQKSATEKLILGANEFLAQINSDQNLQPYLNHYPFSIEDINYSLAFHSKNGDFLTYIFLRDGMIHYCLNDEALDKLIFVSKKNFNEALKEVSFLEDLKN